MDVALAWFQKIASHIDGNWIDIVSLAIGLIFAIVRCKKIAPNRKVISKTTGIDVANGVGIFPLLVLGTSILSSSLLSELMTANRLILSVAGFTALFAILEDWDVAPPP